jgi:transcriptional regulator
MELIVGIEIPITKLIGKWKVNQNRSDSDKLGVVAGLLAKGNPESREMANLVNEQITSLVRD